jgi:hypothetical protein
VLATAILDARSPTFLLDLKINAGRTNEEEREIRERKEGIRN